MFVCLFTSLFISSWHISTDYSHFFCKYLICNKQNNRNNIITLLINHSVQKLTNTQHSTKEIDGIQYLSNVKITRFWKLLQHPVQFPLCQINYRSVICKLTKKQRKTIIFLRIHLVILTHHCNYTFEIKILTNPLKLVQNAA